MTEPPTMDRPALIRKRPLKLKPAKNGTRHCWVVLMWDAPAQAEIVIGAATKGEVIRKAQELYGPCVNPEKVYWAKWHKVSK